MGRLEKAYISQLPAKSRPLFGGKRLGLLNLLQVVLFLDKCSDEVVMTGSVSVIVRLLSVANRQTV